MSSVFRDGRGWCFSESSSEAWGCVEVGFAMAPDSSVMFVERDSGNNAGVRFAKRLRASLSCYRLFARF